MLLVAPLCAALLIAAPPPERDDLLDLADEADIVDQARIEQALYDSSTSRSGLRLLEQEIRDRRDRRSLRERTRAIVAGFELKVVELDASAHVSSEVRFIASIAISFDLLFSHVGRGAFLLPIAESVRVQHCDRIIDLEIVGEDERSILQRIAADETARALGCAWASPTRVEVP